MRLEVSQMCKGPFDLQVSRIPMGVKDSGHNHDTLKHDKPTSCPFPFHSFPAKHRHSDSSRYSRPFSVAVPQAIAISGAERAVHCSSIGCARQSSGRRCVNEVLGGRKTCEDSSREEDRL